MENIQPNADIETDLSIGDLSDKVSIQPLFANQTLPIAISPLQGKMDLKIYIKEQERALQSALVKHGAILFRGFEIDSVESFNSLITCFSNRAIPYMFRSSPRFSLSDRVYFSTTYPESRTINMHSESSYSYAWGQKIIFCCIKAPAEKGETPIADNRKVLSSLSTALLDKFEQRGVIYQRNLSPEIGMSWEEVFQTSDQEEVKSMCRENNIKFDFLSKDNLVLRWRKPAIYTHPTTQERTWFNHAFFFNKYSLLDEMGLPFDESSVDDFLPSNTFFGDGSEISHDEYLEMKKAYEINKVMFPWQNGDVLLLDNMLTAHGRSPYKGERQIVVSIVEPLSDSEIKDTRIFPL